MNLTVRFRKKDESVCLPVYETAGSAGADLRARISSSITIEKGEHRLVPTGLYPEIPSGYEIQVRPRSGLALKKGVTVLNTPGTVDSDYRGEIMVNIINLGHEPFTVNDGDRIAQIIVSPVLHAAFVEADSLSETERGDGGFGSTGV